ncbi:hypothetical protein HGRIS_003577 [Hohenbuehelia grisea]|uniref:ABC transporter n=1 Tax=Hohenbuehelia grisea TaxID=104357 RepID=A0ABR3JFW7_9AGAR
MQYIGGSVSTPHHKDLLDGAPVNSTSLFEPPPPSPLAMTSSPSRSLDSTNEKATSLHKEKTKANLRVVDDRFHKRSKFLRVPFTLTNPPPPKESIDDADLLPEIGASWIDFVTFGWITGLLNLGYARALEASDLYKLPENRTSAYIADRIVESFERRRKNAAEYNDRLAQGEVKPGWRSIWWTLRGSRKEREKRWREVEGRRKASLILAMNDSVKWWFWSGGVLRVLGDSAQITSPLVVKAIINFATQSYTSHRTGDFENIPPIGRGIGLVFALLAMQIFASLCTHHFFYRGASTGVLLRGALITAIYQRSLRFTARARSTIPNGKLVNHISTDVSRIDFCCGFFHMAWAGPIQMIICLILLLLNLGPSALAGFGFFLLATPVQTMVMKNLFKLRQKSMIWTDKRAKLLQELLGGMKVIKFFAWEIPFLQRIIDYRQREMSYIRSLLLIRSANNAVAMSLPVLASVLSFVAYSLSGHSLDPAVIFSSLTLFNLLRLPLMFLPMSFSAIADAMNATQRLYGVFEAETLDETRIIEPDLPNAIEVHEATFTWDSPPPQDDKSKKRRAPLHAHKRAAASAKADQLAADKAKADEGTVFKLHDVEFTVPRGKLVAIVGAVGAGKTSLLQGLIGEMRRTSGSVKFGGSVGYCPQSAWIQNASIRENVCFGRPFEEERYWDAIRDSCLEPDLEILPNGDLTEVGEKGISLSGGQKQRVNIARAIYCNTDIQIFDDPLSALDAHVGKAVFQNVLQTSLSGKTRLLVTHALHFLPQVDYIYTIADGRIAERGTYDELLKSNGAFAAFVREFGSQEETAEREEEEEEAVEEASADAGVPEKKKPRKNAVAGAGIMQAEERNTGAIGAKVYKEYASAANGFIVLPLLLLSLVLLQAATVLASYWLVYWQENKFGKPQGFYMGIYAFLGGSQAAAAFLMGSMFATLTYFASQRLHRAAIGRVMHAPMSFFDTTPLGRIMNRFSKDIDTIDNLLGDSMRMFAGTMSSILGAIILISIILPWFLIGVCCIMIVYYYAASFYRASARELKRLDAVLRSSLYSHFSESLSGLATIRAYGESERFRKENEDRVDIENR